MIILTCNVKTGVHEPCQYAQPGHAHHSDAAEQNSKGTAFQSIMNASNESELDAVPADETAHCLSNHPRNACHTWRHVRHQCYSNSISRLAAGSITETPQV